MEILLHLLLQKETEKKKKKNFSFFFNVLLVLLVLLVSMIVEVSCRGAVYTPPNVEKVADMFTRIPVNQGYDVFFGNANVLLTNNGSNADLSLDKISGSGLVSKKKYNYGFFNAAMKLPAGFTSGIVIAFYLSNVDAYPHNHDEIDIELLGHEKRRDWILQTNLYGNGSVSTGREEKFYLWFDPTSAFHDYTILWNNHHILFLVDNIPVREVIHNTAINPIYPSSRPMSSYITIWDGSKWATHGGKYPVNYKYAPFVTSVRGIELEGCSVTVQQNRSSSSPSPSSPPSSSQECSRNKNSRDPVDGEQFAALSEQQKIGLDWARRKHMFYSYCQDKSRYRVMPPECLIPSK